jgi:hypothetical protein
MDIGEFTYTEDCECSCSTLNGEAGLYQYSRTFISDLHAFRVTFPRVCYWRVAFKRRQTSSVHRDRQKQYYQLLPYVQQTPAFSSSPDRIRAIKMPYPVASKIMLQPHWRIARSGGTCEISIHLKPPLGQDAA